MTLNRVVKSFGAVATIAAIAFSGMLLSSRRVQAHEGDDERDEARIRRGFEIAPVPLNLKKKESGSGRTGQLHRQRASRLQRVPQRRTGNGIRHGWQPIFWPARRGQPGNVSRRRERFRSLSGAGAVSAHHFAESDAR